jgi:hypothetical protein
MTKSQKIIIISILFQLAALVYAIVNKLEDVIILTIVFIGVSLIEFFNKKEKNKP